MGIFCAMWWFLLPLLSQSLPSNAGKRDIEEIVVDKKNHVVPLEVSYSEENKTACGTKARTSWGNLETHGLLREYEDDFLVSVKESWEQPHLFGMCLEDMQSTALMATKQLANFLGDPQGRQLVIMHLQNVKWEPGVSMHFHGSVQEHISPILQHLHLLIGVFFLDILKLPVGHLKSKIRMSGEAFPQPQVVCMSPETRYLVLKLSGTVKSVESGDLKLHISFHMKQYPEGLAVPATESEQYLFGMDENCLTKITPVILMIVGHHAQTSVYPSIIQSDQTGRGSRLQSNRMVVPSQKKDEFLQTLSHFSTLLMTSDGKASSTIHLPLDPNDDSAGDLRPQLLNVTEVEALEWLVESQEPLVFLFLPGSKNVLASRIQGSLNGTLLEKITEKMQVVLEDLKEIISTAEHIQILQGLLNSCYGYFNISYLHTEEEKVPQLTESKHRKLHSLMLLKMLQTVRAYWQDRKKLSRQNRGADLKPHCRLQELSINLKPYAEYKDIYFPEEININNCVGPCHFPQTTQSDYQAHVILLIQLQERRQSVLDRPPCCVPIRYQEQWLMVAHENGIKLQLYPNMVAKECGCR
ncbi:PREDICTED: muellerian-inhibiting factor [Nanorana parkeri]|uniref:muellerian-inhibiting factor n=1 Tax=Nanorana parkeri TaxID=125878 RepID=UPI0008542E5D|nr:PREDICTED: muellerian-inhibiting factor [Nanorana parkeri]